MERWFRYLLSQSFCAVSGNSRRALRSMLRRICVSVRRAALSGITLAIIVCSIPTPIAADPVSDDLDKGVALIDDFADNLNAVTGPYYTLMDSYDRLARAISEGKHPDKPAQPNSINDWADFVTSAANKVSTANYLPQIDDPSKYSVSLDQIASCVTQDQSLQLLHNYANAMNTAASEGTATVATLNTYLTRVTQLQITIREFTNYAKAAASVPEEEWSLYFLDAYLDLDQHLNPAITELIRAINNQIDRVTANVKSLQTQSGNLEANLSLLKPNWCILAGHWTGQCVMDVTGIQSSSALDLIKSGGQQSGSFSLTAGSPIQATSVNILGKTELVMTLGKSNSPLQGNFNSAYTAWAGTVTLRGSNITYSCALNGAGQ